VSERLRIAVFVGAFPVASETFILRQIAGLLELGHDVHVFANARAEDSVVHEIVPAHRLLDRTTFVDGPPESVVWEMPVRPVTGETWLPGATTPVLNLSRLAHAFPVLARCAAVAPGLTRRVLGRREYGYRAESFSGAYRLATLLQASREFDVLHAHFGPVANAFGFARELFRAPLVVSFHGYDFCTVPRKEGSDVYHRLWPCADRVIANSHYTRQRLLVLGCPEERVVVVPVGLEPAAFPFRERTLAGPVRLLTVARLVEIKGHEFVLRALAQLRAAGVAFHHDLVGDGPLRKKLMALTSELGLNECVTFHGSRNETDVRGFFDRAHVFVLTSVNVQGDEEGQGLALQEAQACGLPVIATRHGAFPEGVAPEHAGWLVPERDADALAAKLRELIEAHERWPAMGRAGRAFVEQRYDLRALNQRLVEIYRRAIQDFRT